MKKLTDNRPGKPVSFDDAKEFNEFMKKAKQEAKSNEQKAIISSRDIFLKSK